MRSGSHGSFFLTGLMIFGLVYAIWLIQLPPFSWWDGFLMWFYEWVLDWRVSSESTLFYLSVIVPLEFVFFFFKYLLFPSIVTSFLAAFYRP
ncbi:hypothetical protein [Marinobacter sp.]|uniref:hypothetical protein n=1 Tax=Marinobacter sp. TaxID=50741 RepID=UPI003567ACB1